MSEGPALDYLLTTDFRWTQRAFDLLQEELLTVDPHEAGGAPCFVISGPCPRCEHHMTDRQVTTALAGLAGPDRGAEGRPSAEVLLDVTCGCVGEHGNAPEGKVGCGASFRIAVVTG
ncbi:hypothetical protein [Streptomyces triticiradicis]|uniref:Uncharacterized protein n=1 Tax=Streptomyces triticiradicis TaxID=2651189 RepID=A0A7J5DI43_9ACTN|nr:hypothetical protein [Streptomyces triticiradicis]KAB1988308.1 hypothetical protein F8144_14000 [Streptomyces triticiradicis]